MESYGTVALQGNKYHLTYIINLKNSGLLLGFASSKNISPNTVVCKSLGTLKGNSWFWSF